MAVTSPSQKPPVNGPALVPVGEHAGAPSLHLDRVAVVAGSDASCRLHLVSAQVSRHHTLIITTPDEVYVRDLCSRSRTFVNEEPVREAVLKHGSFLRIGRFSFKLADPRAQAADAGRPGPLELRVDDVLVPVADDRRTILIGRRDGCDVVIDDEAVSTIHAVIFAVGGQYMMRDMHSRNGTRLNGRKIHQEELPLPATLTIGTTTLAIASAVRAEPPANAAEEAQTAIPLVGEETEAPAVVTDEPAMDAEAVPTSLATATDESEAPVAATEALPSDTEDVPVPIAAATDESELPVAAPAALPSDAEETPTPPAWETVATELPAVAVVGGLASAVQLVEAPPVQPELEPALDAIDLANAASIDDTAVLPALEPDEPSPVVVAPPADLRDADDSAASVRGGWRSPLPVADRQALFPPAVEPALAVPLREPVEIAVPMAAATAKMETETPRVQAVAQALVAEVSSLSPVMATPVVERPIAGAAESPVAVVPIASATVQATAEIAALSPVAEPANAIETATSNAVEPFLAVEPVAADGEQAAAEDTVAMPAVAVVEESIVPAAESAAPAASASTPVAPPAEPIVPAMVATVCAAAAEPTPAAIDVSSPIAVAAVESAPVAAPVEPVAADVVRPLAEAPALEPEPLAAQTQDTIHEEPAAAEPTLESPVSQPPPIPVEISVTPPPRMAQPTFTLDGVSSEVDNQSLDSLNPVAPANLQAFAPAEAVEPAARFDLGLTAAETASVPLPALAAEPEPLSPPAAPQPPLPAPPPATLPPSPTTAGHQASTWTESFSLDDGFFGVDLNAAGVVVQPQGQGLPPSMPISRVTTATTADQTLPANEPPAALPPVMGGISFSSPIGVNMDLGIGGMGITLPELEPPPEAFGKVSISFGDKDLPERPRGHAPPSAEPLPAEEPPRGDEPAEKLRAGAASKFNFVPKSLSTRRAGAGPVTDEDAAAEEVVVPPTIVDGGRSTSTGSPVGLIGSFEGLTAAPVRQKDAFSEVEPTAPNDAAFGGQRLTRGDDYVIPETGAGKTAVTGEEIKDFSDDPFWDATDDDDIAGLVQPRILLPQPPPAEEVKDSNDPAHLVADMEPLTGQETVAPNTLPGEIPPVEKPHEPRPQRAQVPLRLDLSPLRRPPPAEAFAPRGPHGEPIVLGPRGKKIRIPLLVLLMLAAVVLSLVLIYFTVPVKSQVTGILQFNRLNMVAGSSQWDDWQAAERALITEKLTVDSARKTFAQLTSEANPGFLGDSRLANLAARARFVPAGAADAPALLRLVYDSSDLGQDATRMIALLRAIAVANVPLSAAAHHRADDLRALDDEIKVYNQKQDELKDVQTSQLAIQAAGPTPERLADLEQAVAAQLAAAAAADQAAARDTEHLNRLLTTVPGEVPTTEPSGGLAMADAQLGQWQAQLQDLQQSLAAAQAAAAQKEADTRQRVQETLERFNQDLRAAGAALADNAELVKSFAAIGQRLATVQDLTTALISDGQRLAKDTRDLKRMLGLTPGDLAVMAAAQEMLGNQHKHLADQRKLLDDATGLLQNQLTSLMAATVGLPPAQQDLLRKLRDRLESCAAARRYLDVLVDSAGDPTDQVKAIGQQVAALSVQMSQKQHAIIEATQKRLTDQQRAALANQIQAARDALAGDQAAAATAQAVWQSALTAYFQAKVAQANAQQAAARLAGVKIQLAENQQKLDGLQAKHQQSTLAAAPVFDVKPVEDRDVQIELVDHRQAYSLLATAAIVIVFALIIVLAMRRNRGSTQPAHAFSPAGVPPVKPMMQS